MGRQHAALALAGVNAVLLAALLIREHQVSAAGRPDTLRARAIELVDEQGRVRAQLNVESDGEAVFRLRDSAGQIRVKLGADERGSGLLLLDGSTEPGIHLLSKTGGTSLTLMSKGARRVISAVDGPDLQIDHIILGTANLDEGIERFEKLTGVRPAFGGRHPGRGTQNALASLGSGRYVEIIAPQPEAPESADLRGLRQLKDLTPIGWAVSTKDIAASVQWLTRAGYETSTPAPGSRLRPDGKTLEWTTFGIVKPRLERAPFFINWSSASVHPSADSPTGCELTALNLAVTPGDEDARLLELLGPGVGVGRGSSVPMEVVLHCPKGSVRFPTAMPNDPSAHLSEQEGRNYELIRQIHAPGLGLIQRLRDSGLLAPSAEWWVAGPPSILPFAGTWKGLAGVEEFERRLGETMRYDKVELQRYLVSGDDVAAIFLGEGIARATGRPFRSEIVRLYTFEGGKIVRVRNYYDTAAYVAAVRGE